MTFFFFLSYMVLNVVAQIILYAVHIIYAGQGTRLFFFFFGGSEKGDIFISILEGVIIPSFSKSFLYDCSIHYIYFVLEHYPLPPKQKSVPATMDSSVQKYAYVIINSTIYWMHSFWCCVNVKLKKKLQFWEIPFSVPDFTTFTILELGPFYFISVEGSSMFYGYMLPYFFLLNIHCTAYRIIYNLGIRLRKLVACLSFVRCTYTLTGKKSFCMKIFSYIYHIKPLIFKKFSWDFVSDFLKFSPLKAE